MAPKPEPKSPVKQAPEILEDPINRSPDRPPTEGDGPSGVDLEQLDIDQDPDEQYEENVNIQEILEGLSTYPSF